MTAARHTFASNSSKSSPCDNCKNNPEKWEVSVYCLDATTCNAGHYISQTDAAPPTDYFDSKGKMITECEDYHGSRD